MAAKSILLEKPVHRLAFLIENGHQSVLIDPGAKHHANTLIKEITEDIAISDIRYIILQTTDYLNITAIDSLIAAGFNGDIICHEIGPKYIEDVLNHHVILIEHLDYHLKVDDHIDLSFIPAPFLPFHEGFMTYDNHHQTLYSAHLFSQVANQEEDLFTQINTFHEYVMPSVDFVRQALRKLKNHEIKRIYPRLGHIISGKMVHAVMTHVSGYDFYNTTQVIQKRLDDQITINYEMICNHMLKKLATLFNRSDIANVFLGSKILIDLSADIEIDETTLQHYKLWNYFFEHIFEKRGMSWLVVLEPTVKKYKSLYHIQEPAIYTTDLYKQQTKISMLNETTDDLEKKIQKLEFEITETTDKMLRDHVTELYNEQFMTTYLSQEIQKEDPGLVHVLALFQIDNLSMINKKYGTQQGDDTLRSLAYTLNNIKFERTMVFKQKGPGIFVFIPHLKEEDIQRNLLTCRNKIQESDYFVEPITVSISLALSREIDSRYEDHTRVSSWIGLVLKRMEMAKTKGKSQIIDYQANPKEYVDGVVLIVDEDETYQNMMIKIFERINYKAIVTDDIYKAYEKIQSEPIDIIISEINLSKLDGFQFKHMINQTKDYKNIPFIIVSHHKNLEVVSRANLLDIDLILQKPIIPEELIGHINRMRQRHKRL